MSAASDAILMLSVALADMPADDPSRPALWANPLMASHALFAEALADAEPDEREALEAAKAAGYIVLGESAMAARAEVRTPVKYVNRHERRRNAKGKHRADTPGIPGWFGAKPPGV